MIHALVHSQGVVLGSTYYALELAYEDVTGTRAHFHITSPLGYYKMRRCYPHARPDVLVIAKGGTPYSKVLDFLKRRFRYLRDCWGEAVVFGYKGESYQPQVLRDAGISRIINVEKLGVPALRITDNACSWHKRTLSKCALVALNQILDHKCSSSSLRNVLGQKTL